MKVTVLCLFPALTAGAQSTTQHLPVTDAQKIADALRAGPPFITDDATILDRPAKKGGEFEWATDGLAGRPQHIARLGVAYMYTGALRIRRNCRVSAAMGRTART